MKILYIAPYLPSVIRVRSFHFIKGLKARGHSITCVALVDSYSTQAMEAELTSSCDNLEVFRVPKSASLLQAFTGLFRNIPLQAAFTYSQPMKQRVQALAQAQDFDIIHLEHLRAGPFLPEKRRAPALFDAVDCITDLYRQMSREKPSLAGRLLASLEARKLARYEPALLARFDSAIVTSERDKAGLEELSRQSSRFCPAIEVIPLGVEAEYFNPRELEVEPNAIVFSGKIGYYANEQAAWHFAKDIFPRIKAEKPGAKFTIVGAGPRKRILALGKEKDIVVTGSVPDLREYLARAHVVVCPVRIRVGMQNKLLEAMAMAKAVVAYTDTAIPLRPSEEEIFLRADNPESFARHVLRILEDEPLRRSLGQKAREYVQKNYAWEDKIERLEACYERMIQR